MQYQRNSAETKWPREATVEIASHYRLQLPSKKVAWMDRNSPGWGVVPESVEDMLQEACPSTVSDLESIFGLQTHALLTKLWRGGLLRINGEIGISSEQHNPALRNSTPSNILIKLTGACNWACTYCYDFDKDRFRNKLKLEKILPIVLNAIGQHEEVNLIFHGGEPLLHFNTLRKVTEVAVQSAVSQGKRVRFMLQTNGALIDANIIDFLRQYDFGVGISIDGPPKLNDQTRVDHSGQGTSTRLELLFDRFPEFMTRHVAYLTTVTSCNEQHLEEVMSYLRNSGVKHWKLAIFDLEGRGALRNDLLPSPEPYADFLEQLIRRASGGELHGFVVTTLVEYLDLLMSIKRPHLCHRFPCGAGDDFGVASAKGDYYACDATYHENFKLADLKTWQNPNKLKIKVLDSREQWLLSDESECSSCIWLHHCAGTCMAKALIQHGTVKAVDEFECTVRKRIYPLLVESLSESSSGGLLDYYYSCKSRAGLA